MIFPIYFSVVSYYALLYAQAHVIRDLSTFEVLICCYLCIHLRIRCQLKWWWWLLCKNKNIFILIDNGLGACFIIVQWFRKMFQRYLLVEVLKLKSIKRWNKYFLKKFPCSEFHSKNILKKFSWSWNWLKNIFWKFPGQRDRSKKIFKYFHSPFIGSIFLLYILNFYKKF